jgi:hypothetical protein
MANAKEAIRLARKHLDEGRQSSARVALNDAIRLYDDGDLTNAKWRAVDSLAFSVGVFHVDYERATR